jgi:glutathione S-transferase
MANIPVLGYWDVRGIVGPSRYLLTYVGQEFVDKRYSDFQLWFEGDKKSLPLDFPNLPYYIEGDVAISQSLVVLRHLGRKHGLVGQNEAETLRVELAEQQVVDLRNSMSKVAYTHEGHEEAKAAHIAGLPAVLEKWSKFLGDRKFVAGEKLTYVDFFLYDALDVNRLFAGADILPATLQDFMKRIESLPTLVDYLANLKRLPIFGPMAKWAALGKDV